MKYIFVFSAGFNATFAVWLMAQGQYDGAAWFSGLALFSSVWVWIDDFVDGLRENL